MIVSDNHVLTNHHNVRDFLKHEAAGQDVRITLNFADGSQKQGFVLEIDPDNDLALVGFKGKLNEGLHRIAVGTDTTEGLTIGGYPGCGPYQEKTVQGFLDDNRYPWAFKFPGTFEVGYSGGPVINDEGYLAGLLWGCDAAKGNDDPHGFATRIGQIRNFLAENNILFD